MPTISICLPVYNGERFLSEAVDNVLAQTYGDFELLVADDCSTDSSWEIIQAFARKDSRVIAWRNQANKGLFANYNECIFKSSGDLIKLYAQDDLWDLTILQSMLAPFQEKPDLAMVACNRVWIDESDCEISMPHEFKETGLFEGSDVIRRCLLKLINWIGEPSNVMFPRRFAGAGFDSMYYHLGDMEYWFRILLNGQYQFLQEPLCKFRRHSASTTNKNLNGLLFAIDMLRLADAYESLLKTWDLSAEDMKVRAASTAGSYVNSLARTGAISLHELLNQKPANEAQALRLLDEYKQLAFYALLSGSRKEEAWSARLTAKELELVRVEQDLATVLNSKAWRSTSALRKAIGQVKRIPGRAP